MEHYDDFGAPEEVTVEDQSTVLAKYAYDKYGDFVGWKNYAGLKMPDWDQLPSNIQDAWKASVRAVSEKLASEKIERFQDDPSLTWEERYLLLERHHVLETSILVARLKGHE
jgi:hypothetical protein